MRGGKRMDESHLFVCFGPNPAQCWELILATCGTLEAPDTSKQARISTCKACAPALGVNSQPRIYILIYMLVFIFALGKI